MLTVLRIKTEVGGDIVFNIKVLGAYKCHGILKRGLKLLCYGFEVKSPVNAVTSSNSFFTIRYQKC